MVCEPILPDWHTASARRCFHSPWDPHLCSLSEVLSSPQASISPSAHQCRTLWPLCSWCSYTTLMSFLGARVLPRTFLHLNRAWALLIFIFLSEGVQMFHSITEDTRQGCGRPGGGERGRQKHCLSMGFLRGRSQAREAGSGFKLSRPPWEQQRFCPHWRSRTNALSHECWMSHLLASGMHNPGEHKYTRNSLGLLSAVPKRDRYSGSFRIQLDPVPPL